MAERLDRTRAARANRFCRYQINRGRDRDRNRNRMDELQVRGALGTEENAGGKRTQNRIVAMVKKLGQRGGGILEGSNGG